MLKKLIEPSKIPQEEKKAKRVGSVKKASLTGFVGGKNA